ncbi:MAG TPA: hypothetical protein VHX88_10795 [Solirubrobacteraceae bacterium]|jgi:hypothetical protein|nr:hypothetical protein [Solirubrobacteraceae bacterium]
MSPRLPLRRDKDKGPKPEKPPKLPGEKDWARCAALEPVAGSARPVLVGDGGGPPFPPSALFAPPDALDEAQPDVAALLAHLEQRAAARRKAAPRGEAALIEGPVSPSLEGWRALVRGEGEVLYGHGVPPRLQTVALREDARRGRWSVYGSTAGRVLRPVRDGLRASSWQLDPEQALDPQTTELRLMVTEQSSASGQRADGRVQPPELWADARALVLTVFVTPRPGFQNNVKNPLTPVRVTLPEPLGERVLCDGSRPSNELLAS